MLLVQLIRKDFRTFNPVFIAFSPIIVAVTSPIAHYNDLTSDNIRSNQPSWIAFEGVRTDRQQALLAVM